MAQIKALLALPGDKELEDWFEHTCLFLVGDLLVLFFGGIFFPDRFASGAAETPCAPPPDHMGALKTRLPSLARAADKVVEPLVRGWAPAWGSLLERFSLSSDAPCAGCGEQQAADGAPDTTSGRSRSCCWTLSEDFLGVTGLYFPPTANMIPAALLPLLALVLGVRVCADSMEAPSGKHIHTHTDTRTHATCGDRRDARLAPVRLLTRAHLRGLEPGLVSETSGKSCAGSRVRIALRSLASASSFVSVIPEFQ